MGVLTKSTDVAPVVSEYFSRDLLRRAQPKYVHPKMAQRRPLKQRNGNTMTFRKINRLSAATVPLVEGVSPQGKQLSNTDVSVSLVQHGDYVTLTDLIQAYVEHPILNDAQKVLAEQVADTVDQLARDKHVAGTNVLYGGGVASRTDIVTTTEKVTTALLDRAIRFLNNKNASRFTEIIKPGVNIATVGIRPAFWAVVHPDVLFTLETLSGWKSVTEYASLGGVMEAEVGAYKDIRFLCTTNAKVWAGGGGTASGDVKSTSSNADVYAILVYAQDAVGFVPLDGMSLESIIHPIGQAGASDPLNQVGTSGWKRVGAEVVLQDDFLLRLEVAAGDAAP